MRSALAGWIVSAYIPALDVRKMIYDVLCVASMIVGIQLKQSNFPHNAEN
jgi:hypothetical protein